MIDYFAYTRASRPTGRTLADLLGFENFGSRRPQDTLGVLLRWGSRKRMPQAERTFNTAQAIARAADKVITIERLTKAGIKCVPCVLTWEDALALSGNGIILGRSRHGFGGKGIRIYDPSGLYDDRYEREPVRDHEWYSIYHEPSREVRLHVVGGEVVRIQGKYLDFPDDAERNPFVRNHRSGYRFRKPRRELHSRRKELAIEAVKALGLHFGAVDMMLFREQEPMVLEINTAPACSPLTAASYAEALARMIERRAP